MRHLTAIEIRRLIASLLRAPCPNCGAATRETIVSPRDTHVVCSKACGWLYPVDTGPFSLGRRVD